VHKYDGSQIKYNVSVGYIGSVKNIKFVNKSVELRKTLINKGAKKIVCYFDQGTYDDPRWGPSHELLKNDYKLFLEKVINNKSLGLIIKPKKPGVLRASLGEISNLLDEAIDTGRCYIFENSSEYSPKNFSEPPALAAMASDISINSSLVGATAGVESVLTGTPTLMFDRFDWSRSIFYNLEEGKVVFNDYELMWDKIETHLFKKPINGFGDWSPILDEIDPFRDGKANIRMTELLKWTLEGLEKDDNKDNVLKKVVDKYSLKWGEDKVYRYKN
jgi:hypothetical protein